jgi:plastocyanin
MSKSMLFVLLLIGVSFYVIHDAYGLAIFQRPDGLGSGNNWPVGTFDSINEGSRDDADFITSSGVRQNQQDTVIFSLSNAEDPVVDIDHVVRYTYRENGLSAAHSPSLEVTLQQGATDLITWTESGPLPNVFTLSTREVPPSVVAQIGNYYDLRLKFRVFCQAGVTCDNSTPEETVSISWAELQYETYTTPRDHPPPTISGIGFYKITPQNQTTNNIVTISNYSKYTDTTDPQNYGKYAKSGKYHKIGEAIPTFETQINKPTQVQVKLDGVFASTRIEHLSLISTNAKSDLRSPNFEIIADKGKKTIVIDPTKILKDVKSTYSLEDGSLWVNFDLVFQKSLKKSDIVLQAWDELRRPVYSHLSDAWEITDPLQNVIQIAEVPDRIKVAITKKTQHFGCVENKTCFMPPEITIRKGGSVVWKNEDSTLHTIISGTPTKGPDGRFNFALIPQHSFERVFPFTGNYSYYCSIHPWYVGSIVVSDSKENHTHQFVDFTVLLPRGGSVVNGQTVILKDRNTEVLLSGHLPNVVKPTQISIYIISPDRDVEKLSVKTTNEGYYSVQTKLAKKWQEGKFQIISKYKDEEIGNINFTIVDKPIKKQNK